MLDITRYKLCVKLIGRLGKKCLRNEKMRRRLTVSILLVAMKVKMKTVNTWYKY